MIYTFKINTDADFSSEFYWHQSSDFQAMESARFNAKNFSINTKGGTWARCDVTLRNNKVYTATAKNGKITACHSINAVMWKD